MFTGLVQQVGTVAAVEPTGAGATLRIDVGEWTHAPAPGASIAVSGCCLTLAEPAQPGHPWRFDVIRQSLDLTTLGRRRPGDRVNLEPSVTPSTPLGGHLVQGHVEATAEVLAVSEDELAWRIRFAWPEPLRDRIGDQGSITVDGTSLTVAGTGPDWFEVALIPTTLAETTLGDLRPGDHVNLETDLLARFVVDWLERHGPGLLARFAAREAGG